jgi:hypothetical protein
MKYIYLFILKAVLVYVTFKAWIQVNMKLRDGLRKKD